MLKLILIYNVEFKLPVKSCAKVLLFVQSAKSFKYYLQTQHYIFTHFSKYALWEKKNVISDNTRDKCRKMVKSG